MNEKQKVLFSNIPVKAHVARYMGIKNCELVRKVQALSEGKNPSYGLKDGNPRLFKPGYIAAQIEFWSDLAVIAAENLKELEGKKNEKTSQTT